MANRQFHSSSTAISSVILTLLFSPHKLQGPYYVIKKNHGAFNQKVATRNHNLYACQNHMGPEANIRVRIIIIGLIKLRVYDSMSRSNKIPIAFAPFVQLKN